MSGPHYSQNSSGSENRDASHLGCRRGGGGVDAVAKSAGFDCDGQPSQKPKPPFAGHLHCFEGLSFTGDSDWPPLWVIGNSGVELNTDEPHGYWAGPGG